MIKEYDRFNTYYGTITWTNPNTIKDKSITIHRASLEDLVEGISEHLETHKARKAIMESCAVQHDMNDGFSEWTDITELVQKELN